MGSTVKLRPNHYEVLGLTPGASSDEIAQAFAKALSDFGRARSAASPRSPSLMKFFAIAASARLTTSPWA